MGKNEILPFFAFPRKNFWLSLEKSTIAPSLEKNPSDTHAHNEIGDTFLLVVTSSVIRGLSQGKT